MRLASGLTFASLLFAAHSILAGDAARAQEVVQALPNPASAELADAMRRLSTDPESFAALVDAGQASLKLDDVDAAAGFFMRAQRANAASGEVLAGLARVALRRGEPIKSLQLFDEANLAGEAMAPYAAERGFAYDLVGNNVRAQRLYLQALEQGDDPETVRKLALSYAISGEQAASEEVLLPLLQRRDLAAFRARAFALAILGQGDEAVTIAETMLPARLANRIAPYLRYMPRLTRAQQAAAANLGRFPAAADMGREDPRMAALGISSGVPRRRPGADQRLIPGGEPLGPAMPAAAPAAADMPAEATSPAEEPVVAAVLDPAPAPTSELSPVVRSEQPGGEVSGELPALARRSEPVVQQIMPEAEPEAQPAPAAQTVPEPEVAPATATIPEPEPERMPAPEIAPAGQPIVVARLEDPKPVAEPVSSEPEPALPEQSPMDLAEAFAEFAEADAVPTMPARDAVDITAIEIPRERPQPVEPPKPVHPSRHWVQLATGRDISAFRFDWRRFQRGSEGLLDGREAFYTAWNSTNRLLTGPFDSARVAQQFVTELGEAGIDAFRFVSEEGQEIKGL